MSNFTRTHKIVILIIIIIITIGFGYKMVANDSKDIEIQENGLFSEIDDTSEIKDDLNTSEESEIIDVDENIPKQVIVHVTGEVAKPGIVTLENGDRVIDAIKKAGGLTSLADERSINLAQKLFDEDKVMIPSVDESLELEPPSSQTDPQNVVTSKNNTESTTGTSSGSSSGQININTASKEELKTLSGVGDVTADKIIDYRSSTKFGSIEDIKNVSGIGEKKFEAIKNMITTR